MHNAVMRQEKVQPEVKAPSSSVKEARIRSSVGEQGAKGMWSAYLPAGFLLAAGLIGLGLASLTDGPNSGWYLVVAPPGSTRADTINLVSAADGRLVQAGRFSNIVIAGSARSDFPQELRKAGAWLAVAAPARGGCLDPSFREQSL